MEVLESVGDWLGAIFGEEYRWYFAAGCAAVLFIGVGFVFWAVLQVLGGL